jgi:UrcA family protein
MNTFFSLSSARAIAVSKQVTLAALSATALSLFSLGVSAEPLTRTQQVDFHDLDLAKAHDTQRLYRRLRTASLEVCSDLGKNKSTLGRDRHRQCVDRALTDAIATISHPSLTSLHASKKETKLAQGKSESTSKS